MKVSNEDAAQLADRIKVILGHHSVDEAIRYSVTADVMFAVSVLIDQKSDSNLHESIFSIVDDVFEID